MGSPQMTKIEQDNSIIVSESQLEQYITSDIPTNFSNWKEYCTNTTGTHKAQTILCQYHTTQLTKRPVIRIKNAVFLLGMYQRFRLGTGRMLQINYS